MAREADSVPPVAGLGLTACTALVVGNMIGSGYLPAAGITRRLRADLARRLDRHFARSAGAGGDLGRKTGGPYAYTEAGYGEFAGRISRG